MIGRIGLYCCALSAALAAAMSSSAEFSPVRQPPAESASSQRLIVKLRDAGPAAIANGTAELTRRNGLKLLRSRHIAGGLHAVNVQPATSGDTVEATLARLRADPAVKYVEVDRKRYAHAVPNDPLFAGSAGQWYLQDTSVAAAATDAVTAWNSTTGSNGLVIAELDTGVLYNHPDLLNARSGGRLLPGYDFIADLITAGDGDGLDPDASDPGDFVTQAEAVASPLPCTVGGSSWHGTRVAGILGAITNNSTGIAGLTWSGWILPVRVLGKCGGFDSDILEGMLWAAGVHVTGVPDNPYPAKIINMSLGADGAACPADYEDEINQLTAMGVLVVISAGNSGGPVDSPANCPGAVAVAGLRHIGTKVGFSSLGPEVALSAPAGNCVNGPGQPCLFSINTTFNTSDTTPALGTDSYTDQANTSLGTSFSAPIVAGIAGLMKSVNGNLNPTQLIARLQEGSRPFPTTSTTVPAPAICHVPASVDDVQSSECICTTQTCGAGMANAPGAINAAARPIAAVSVPASVSAGQNVVLQGGGSAAACGRSIASYAWTIVSAVGPPPVIGGANTATATVVAPASNSFTVRLTVTDNVGRTDTADTVVTVASAATSAPANAGSSACLAAVTIQNFYPVAISPTSATLAAAGGTQAFSATVAGTASSAVYWQVNGVTGGNSSVGTITTLGFYSAPASVPAPATVTVGAVAQADLSSSAAVQVTITAAVIPNVTPSSGGGGGMLDPIGLLALSLLAWRRRRLN